MQSSNVRLKLSHELRRLRKISKLTQEEVAERAGISHRYYQILESHNPTRTATIEILEKLSKVFKTKFLNF
jgi:transcriptional regulator with XRE-family HTH domain